MRLSFMLAQAILQSAIAQMALLGYQLYTTMDIVSGVTTTITLLFFLGIYQIGLSMAFFAFSQTIRLIVVPFISSFLTAVTLWLYPALGFSIDFWILFGVLFAAGIFSTALLFMAGASWSDANGKTT